MAQELRQSPYSARAVVRVQSPTRLVETRHDSARLGMCSGHVACRDAQLIELGIQVPPSSVESRNPLIQKLGDYIRR